MFKIGDRVMVIDRNNVSGTVNSIDQHGAINFFGVLLDSNDLIHTTENNLRELIIISTPFDLIRQANFQKKETFLISSVLNKMYGNSNDIIATLKSSKTTFLPYQFKPLNKFLKSENRRILIADEVGLGKTIEAGYILAELSLRGQVKNCLVICKSSLKEKWQNELREKFGFDFKIYNRKELIEGIEEDAYEGNFKIFGIINYDYREKDSNQLLELLEQKGYFFDLLIIDEAHILRNETTIKHKAVSKIIETAKNTVLMTATPVMTSLINLYSLVKIIEPRYNNHQIGNIDFGYSLFVDHLSLSRPFIEAINNLNAGQIPHKVIENLNKSKVILRNSLLDGSYTYQEEVSIADRFENDPLFRSIIKMKSIDKFSDADIAILQKNLTELNSFQDIITRTRRREAQTDIRNIVTRNAIKEIIKFSEIENDYYQEVIDTYDAEPLVLVQKKRQLTSCLPAYIEKYDPNNINYETFIQGDSKFKKLIQILEKVVIQGKKKVIIFSFFKNTLSYLQVRLQTSGLNTLKLDGDVKTNLRQGIIDEFKTSTNIQVLLLSEVGNEGLDMQFCDSLVNYDLPWNPMIVEQRIGRIDRIGQQSSVINIYNLCIEDTIEEQIFDRLMDRINVFKQSIGNLEDILTTDKSIFEIDDKLETEFYGHKLTKEARERRLEEIKIAIETAKLEKKQIEQDLDESFLNDQYISDEIAVLNKRKKFITPDDLKALFDLLFHDRFTPLRRDFTSKEKYIRFVNGREDMLAFIEENIPKRNENPQLYNKYLKFKNKVQNGDKILVTFEQEEAYNNKELEFLSTSHPLVKATFNYYKTKGVTKNNAYYFTIKEEQIPNGLSADYVYVLAKYQMEASKYTMTKNDPDKSTFEMNILIGLDANGNASLIDQELTELLLSIDFQYWDSPGNTLDQDDCKELIEKTKSTIVGGAFTRKMEIEQHMKDIHLSRQNRLIDTEIDFLERQLIKDNDVLNNDSNNPMKFIIQSRIKKYEEKIDQLKSQKKKIRFELYETLQSITLITIN